MIIKIIRHLWRVLRDCVFPIRCLSGCGRYDDWLCPDCRKLIGPPPEPECPICRQPQLSNNTCSKCLNKSSLTGLIVRADYQQPLVQHCVHALKYKYIEDIGEIIGNELVSAIKNNLQTLGNHCQQPLIVPVPLHWQRKNERGFNQADVIAKSASRALDWPLRADILSRTRYTAPQAHLPRSERLGNLANVFRSNSGVVLSGQTAILIDDVATTTATLEACARALRQIGARDVWGVVFARSKNN